MLAAGLALLASTMLTTALLAISALLFVVLLAYGVGYVLSAVGFVFLETGGSIPTPTREDAGVTVLVPAFNEGSALVDTVETLLHQDYRGPVLVQVLIEDEEDSSFRPLCEAYDLDERLCVTLGRFTLELCLTGLRRKHSKVNRALQGLTSTYVAFLDADHRAEPEWLRASVAILERGEHAAVQSRRAPLEARTLFQFWDSAENHLGNEVLNHLSHAAGLSGFFTGTTCVFRSSVFEDRQLPDSITEDTFLSYELLCEGQRIAYNGTCGSFEEVAPDVGTYVARRRRWSSGHNHTFFTHLRKILRAPLRWREKIQLLFHGAFFFVPTLVVALINCFGLYFFLQLTTSVRLLAFVLSVLISSVLAFLVSPSLLRGVQNLVLALVWVFPQIATASIWAYKLLGDEIFFQIIEFPYTSVLGPLGLALFLAPLSVLVVGAARLRRPSLLTTLLLLPTFPLILFLDIFAAYIGLMDRIFGRTVWGTIRRSNSIEASFLPKKLSSILTANSGGIRWARALLGASLLALVGLVAVNDLLVVDNCGHPIYLLGRSIAYENTEFDTRMRVRIDKTATTTDEVEIVTSVEVESEGTQPVAISIHAGSSSKEALVTGDGNVAATTRAPLGFDTLDVNVTLSGAGSSCSVGRKVSTTVRELRDGKLYLNGEEFLIKGVVPSFRTPHVDLALRQGLEQIKALGANTIRIYHTPTEALMDLAEELDLMLVVQPDESTWKNIDMSDDDAARELFGRYRKLVGATEGRANILIDNVGNELELASQGASGPRNIAEALRMARADESYRFPLSYSTYAVFHDYPVDILAVNMLDSGDTYWRDAVDLIRAKNNAFYASEFGGFVAFYEEIDPLLRASRVRQYWRKLQEAGSSGAIFFQSHDNWAQPVAVGFNDPFNPEQPDDLRGIWDHENQPKLIHDHLKALYTDVVLQLEGPADALQVSMRNRRPYRLQDLSVRYGDAVVFTGTLDPGQRVVLDVTLAPDDTQSLAIRHTTHRGLHSSYTIALRDPAHLQRPYVTNTLTRVTTASQASYEIELFGEDELRFHLPGSWSRYRIAGEERDAKAGLNTFRFPDPARVVSPSLTRLDPSQERFVPVPSDFTDGGAHTLRIQLPEVSSLIDYTLVFEGVGAQAMTFIATDGSKIRVKTHSYRENRIPMRTLLPALQDQALFVQITRDSTYYVAPELTPNGRPIEVSLKRPWLEKIHRTRLEKVQ